MNEKKLGGLGYYAIFWVWVLLFEPIFIDIATQVVHEQAISIGLGVITGAAIIAEAMVWRSKVVQMKAKGTFPQRSDLMITLWVGHMVGSMIMYFICVSALGLFDIGGSGNGELSVLSVGAILGMMALVIKEIVLLMHLVTKQEKPGRYSENVTNGTLLFVAMVMHACFWGITISNAAPLSSYGFVEMLILQAPLAGVIFLISYLPSRMLTFLEEYTQSKTVAMEKWTTISFTIITLLLALKGIY